MALASAESNKQDKQCDICLRCFARTEHLARHRRTHTKEKPFSCPYCPRAFQRSDVKAAHVKSCHAAPSNHAEGEPTAETSGSKRARVACDNCRRLKTRCDGQERCARCQAAGRTCRYSAVAATNDGSQPSTQTASEVDSGIGTLRPESDGYTAAAGPTPPQIPLIQSSGVLYDPSAMARIDPFQINRSLAGVPLTPQGPAVSILQTPLMGQNLGIPLTNVDTTMMGDFAQIPIMNSQYWFEQSDFNFTPEYYEPVPFTPAMALTSPMHTLTTMIQDYFDGKSRDPSPSSNKASKMWYSAQPNLQNHNRDIIRIFIGLFRNHIPRTFRLFDETSQTGRRMPPYYTLAMAANGGLFCSVPGSAEVAKTMYNDARRLLLHAFNMKDSPSDLLGSRGDPLTFAKTFILLSIYGLCSGDKRAFEFIEVFHSNLIFSVQEYAEQNRSNVGYEETQSQSVRLLEALHILDCYRVTIMTLPPSLSWHFVEQLQDASPLRGELVVLYDEIARLTHGDRASKPAMPSYTALPTITSLTALLWPATYSCRNTYGSTRNPLETLPTNKPDVAALAFDTWLRSQQTPIDPNVLAVYHLMSIMLCANITVLQRYAHAASPQSQSRDPDRSVVAREVHEWARDASGDMARWHGKSLIAIVENGLAAQSQSQSHAYPQSDPVKAGRRITYEAPHMPYAIYYATLVLWCSDTAIAVDGRSKDSAPSSSSAPSASQAQVHIARGERILAMHKVHIAQLLSRVLHEIK